MAFTPKSLDGQAAAQRLLAFKTYPTGMCLQAVWKAFGSPKSDGKSSYGLARNVWEQTPSEHRHTGRDVPAGAIVLFRNTAKPSAAGHIAISLGGESIVSTDKPGNGKVGVSSISAIEGSWGGRTYWGWSDKIMGHHIVNLGSRGAAAPAAGAPAQAAGNDVASVVAIQALLTARGFTCVVDGQKGAQTTSQVRAFQAATGQVIDGWVGNQTWGKLALPVDGDLGPLTIKAMQAVLRVPVDGSWQTGNTSSPTTRALQAKLGQVVDGGWGPVSRKAFQRHLSQVQDANVGAVTIRALQTRLNAGTF